MKKTILLFAVCLLYLTCGCDYREIDRGYLVTAIGFSQKDNKTQIYVEALSSDINNQDSKREVLVGEGKTENDALNDLKSQLVKPLYFEQMGVVAVEKDIDFDYLEFLQNIPNLNYGVYLIKTKDVAALFAANTPSGILGYDVIGLLKTDNKDQNQLYRINQKTFKWYEINFTNQKLQLADKE